MSDVWATIAAERGALASDLAGLALHATDDDWQHGRGEAVEGPLLSLLLATTGRAAACDDLIGPGVPTLRSRCTRGR